MVERSDAWQELVQRHGWTDEALALAVAARFRCAWCEQHLLASPWDYDAWQVEGIERKVVVCATCVRLRGDFVSTAPTPEQRLADVRRHVLERRAERRRALEDVRQRARALRGVTEG